MSRIHVPGSPHPLPTVADVMTRDVATCSPHATLADAARLMWDRDCGFVPVTEAPTSQLRGVVTDRDACMASLTQGRALCDLPVRVAMSTRVVTVRPEDALAKAHALFRMHKIRRLPVVDADERLVGVLSLNDVARHAATPEAAPERRDVADTLGEICRPRSLARA